MTTELRRITFLCRDPAAQARFWGHVLHRSVVHSPWGEHIQMVDGNQPQALHFEAAPGGSAPVTAVRLAVGAVSGTLADEVARLTALGAAVVAKHTASLEPGWVLMTDPEGNEFTLEASEEELLDFELGGEQMTGRPID